MVNYCASCLRQTSNYKDIKRRIFFPDIREGDSIQVVDNRVKKGRKADINTVTTYYTINTIPLCKTCANLDSTKAYKYSFFIIPIFFLITFFALPGISILAFAFPIIIRVLTHLSRLKDNEYIFDSFAINMRGRTKYRNFLYLILKNHPVHKSKVRQQLTNDIYQLFYGAGVTFYAILINTIAITPLTTWNYIAISLGVGVLLLSILSLLLSIRLYRVVPQRLNYKVNWIKEGTLELPPHLKDQILNNYRRYLDVEN